MRMKLIAIVSDNPGSFLPPMLQGMQAQGGMRRRFLVAEYTEHTTFFMEFVVIERTTGEGMIGLPSHVTTVSHSRGLRSACDIVCLGAPAKGILRESGKIRST